MAAPKQKNKKPQSKWTIVRRVNVFFRRARRGEVLTFLAFAGLAFLFWAQLTLQEQSTQEFIVELHITDQPQDKVFTTHVPTQLRVTLTDNNKQLLSYKYNGTMKELSINFERYADVAGSFRVSAAELQSLLRTELSGSTVISAIFPAPIDARFAQTEGRKFPVRLSNHYLPYDNYRIHTIQIGPDSVIINAPNSVLDTLRWVIAQPSHSSTLLRDTLVETLPLELPLGVKATPDRVTVTVPVSKYVEKVLQNVELTVLNEPRNLHLVVFPYVVQVACLVDFDNYGQISEGDFEVVVDCPEKIKQGEHGHLPIRVRYKGEDNGVVTNVTVSPLVAEYVVEPVANYNSVRHE